MQKIRPFRVLDYLVFAVISAFGILGILHTWNSQQQNMELLQAEIKKIELEVDETADPKDRTTLKKDILAIKKDMVSIQNAAYLALVQAVGGTVLGLTAYIGYRNSMIGEQNLRISEQNLGVSEEKQVTERFAKAIEHLGSGTIDIRLGGIYALEQIARDSPKNHWMIVEILSAFIREKAPIIDDKNFDVDKFRLPTDIQAAMTVLGRRNKNNDLENGKIDLRKMMLVGLEIGNKASLGRVLLNRSDLRRADLRGADLRGADLQGADLWKANLRKADFTQVNLDSNQIKLALYWEDAIYSREKLEELGLDRA